MIPAQLLEKFAGLKVEVVGGVHTHFAAVIRSFHNAGRCQPTHSISQNAHRHPYLSLSRRER